MPLSKITSGSFSTTANTNIDNGVFVVNPSTNQVGIGQLPNGSASATGRLQVASGGISHTASNQGMFGNVYFNDGWKYFANGHGGYVKFGDASTAAIELATFGNNTSGAGATGSAISNLLLQSDGVVNLNYGQLKFPATQNASSDPNTLDDYEEGTFIPILNASGSSPTVTYTLRYGYYVKIGKMVYISLRVQVATISGGSGSVLINGLPFSALTGGPQQNLGGTFVSGVAWGGSSTQISPWIPADTGTVQYRGLVNNASNIDTEISGVSGGDYLDAQGWYIANA